MQNYGIPISGKEPIRHELGDVTYLLRHAIGSVEGKVQAIQGAIYNINSYIPAASKQVDAENPGKTWEPGARMEAVSKVAQTLGDEQFWQNYSAENEAKRRDQIFDVICQGWEGECYQLIDGEKPSDHVKAAVKKEIVEWWLATQLTLSGEDQKNLGGRPDPSSPTPPESPMTVLSADGKTKSDAVA